LSLVGFCAGMARSPLGRRSAIVCSWMGDGFIYLALTAFVLLTGGLGALVLIVVAAVNIGLLHCMYPIIKNWTARPRPYRLHPDLAPLSRPLDEYSFPSGHAMTLTAALVPIALSSSELLFPALVLWGVMSWARLASAHHYPSDILGGTAMALLVSCPISHFLLKL